MIDTSLMLDILSGVVGALVTGAAYSLYNARRSKRAIAALDAANSEIFASFAAAERVLRAKESPTEIREAVLLLVKGMSSAELGKFITKRLMNRKNKGTGDDPISKGLLELRERNPSLAEDAEHALVGLMVLGLPSKYAGKRAPEVISHNVATPTRTLGIISNAINDSHVIDRRRPIGSAAMA